MDNLSSRPGDFRRYRNVEMAGPSASVLARFDAAPPCWREILSPSVTTWYAGDSCGVADTTRFGGNYTGEERPFVGSVEPFTFDAEEFPDDAALSDAIRQFTGIHWTHSIVVAAMCNQPQDHRILCELMIDIADRVGGIIDFDCLDAPLEVKLHRCTWTFEHDEWWTLLGSADEARAWLRHPGFHMLK